MFVFSFGPDALRRCTCVTLYYLACFGQVVYQLSEQLSRPGRCASNNTAKGLRGIVGSNTKDN